MRFGSFRVGEDPVGAELLAQPHAEVERHPGGAEVLGRVVTARLVRVQDRHRRRHRLRHGVVIDDHHLEPERVRPRDLGDRGDPAVEGDQHPGAVGGDLLDRLEVQPVPLVDPVRDVGRDLGPELAQEQVQQRGRADAVDVVVAVEGDLLPLAHRPGEPLDRRRHPLHRERVGQVGELVREEPLGDLGGLEPMREHPGRERVNPQARRERPRPLLGYLGDEPPHARCPSSRRPARPARARFAG